jgi:hypothetical protein
MRGRNETSRSDGFGRDRLRLRAGRMTEEPRVWSRSRRNGETWARAGVASGAAHRRFEFCVRLRSTSWDETGGVRLAAERRGPLFPGLPRPKLAMAFAGDSIALEPNRPGAPGQARTAPRVAFH